MTDSVELEVIGPASKQPNLSAGPGRGVNLRCLRANMTRLQLAKLVLFGTSLFLFILAIILIGASAHLQKAIELSKVEDEEEEED